HPFLPLQSTAKLQASPQPAKEPIPGLLTSAPFRTNLIAPSSTLADGKSPSVSCDPRKGTVSSPVSMKVYLLSRLTKITPSLGSADETCAERGMSRLTESFSRILSIVSCESRWERTHLFITVWPSHT